MMGDIKESDTKGIIPRLVESVFSAIEECEENVEFTVKLSYVEIYNERLRDLLEAGKENLKIRENATGVWIEDVSEH
jgi:kinesin family protein 5